MLSEQEISDLVTLARSQVGIPIFVLPPYRRGVMHRHEVFRYFFWAQRRSLFVAGRLAYHPDYPKMLKLIGRHGKELIIHRNEVENAVARERRRWIGD